MNWRSIDVYKQHFSNLAATGIPLCIYLNVGLEEYGAQLETTFPNVKVLDYVTVDMSFVPPGVILPTNRNNVKDTVEYLCITLMKLKLLAQASLSTYIKTDAIAWIDFGIWHVIKHPEQTRTVLHQIAEHKWSDNILYNSGIWEPNTYNIIDYVCWRYCGGFMVGKKELFIQAYAEQQKAVAKYLPHLMWEVNYWSEMPCFTWYQGNHDDAIFNVPLN
jgi:hypothetical protein